MATYQTPIKRGQQYAQAPMSVAPLPATPNASYPMSVAPDRTTYTPNGMQLGQQYMPSSVAPAPVTPTPINPAQAPQQVKIATEPRPTPQATAPVSYLDPSVQNTPVAQVRPVEMPAQTMTGQAVPTDTTIPPAQPLRPAWETETEKFYKGLQAETGKSAEQIRSEELSRVQAQIDAINQIYDQELNRVRDEGAGRLAQTSSIAVSAGLAGSPFQQTQETKTQQFNQRQEQALQAERAAKITAILSGAEDKASQRFEKERELARQGGLDYINFLKETAQSAKQDAVNTIGQLAKGGVSLDEIPKERLRQIVQDSGYDDFTIRALYNSQINQPTQFTTVGDKLVGYYFDPSTQAIKTFESAPVQGLASGIKYDFKTTADGTVLLVPETIDPNRPLDEQIKMYGSQGQFEKPRAVSGGADRLSTIGALSPLSESIRTTPSLFNTITPSQKAQVLTEFQVNGIDTSKLVEKPLTQAQLSDITGFDTLKRNAELAKTYLEDGLNTGPLISRINQGLSVIGQAPREFTGYESARSNMESILMNLRSGAAVTPSEAKRLENFIPQRTDDEKTAKQKIDSFIQEVQASQENYTKRASQSLQEVRSDVSPQRQEFKVGSYTVEVE